MDARRSPDGGRGPATQRFVRQHEELAVMAKDLVKSLDTRALADDPTSARRLLASFSGRLRVHAAMEQEALYPRLLESDQPAVAAKAQELLEEVGPMYQDFFTHIARWAEAEAIKADPEAFCRETMMMLHKLRLRMKRENEELYPLVERAEDAAAQDG